MVYDCFTFFNELDLLEIRLNELKSIVDKFVLVEATKTHQGADKPLYYELNKERFAHFHKKIIHVVVDHYPENQDNNPWIFERHQRNMVAEALGDCESDDTILLSDLDEIPNPKQIVQHLDQNGLRIFKQRMSYYFVNMVNDTQTVFGDYAWNGTVMISFEQFDQAQELRDFVIKLTRLEDSYAVRRGYWQLWKLWKFRNIDMKGLNLKIIDEGGWHFSYLGGVEKIIHKIEAFAHHEYNKAEFKETESINKVINEGKDIFGRGLTYQIVPLDESFPEYILKNKKKYEHLIKRLD